MPELLRMPALTAAATEAVLSRWPLSQNDAYSAKDVIATVETEKALVDVEAEADGVLLMTLVEEGSEVAVGTAIAVLGKPGEAVDDLQAVLVSLGVAQDPAPAAGAPDPGAAAAQDGAAQDGAAQAGAAQAGAAQDGAASASGRTFASPLARRLASEAGLLVSDISGTGPSGRIVRRDVEAAVAERVAFEEADVPGASPAPAPAPTSSPAARALPVAAPAEAPAPALPAAAAPAAASAAMEAPAVAVQGTGWTDQPLTRMRRAVASRLAESSATAPHFYVRGSARVDRLFALRAELNAGGGTRVSVNDLVVKAVAQAHRLVPAMNVVWLGDAVRVFSGVDVAVAVATENGLYTPVLRAVDRTSVTAVAEATQDAVARAKAGRLQQHELEGGSVTVTNLGMYGVEEFSAILNPPQASILAVGAARQEPVVVDGALEVATVLRVTLSVDHRPVDGATAAQWMAAFVGLLENPLRILA